MKELVCIVCPNGCVLRCEAVDGRIAVSGNRCPRGEAFAQEELTSPRRTVCTTVKTAFADMPVLPVRTSEAVPKSRMFDVVAAVNAVCVERPMRRGDVVIQNVLGLGVDMIATADTPQRI